MWTPEANGLMTGLVMLPLLGAVAVSLLPRRARWPLATAVAIATAGLTWQLWQLVAAAGPVSQRVGGWGSPLGIDLYADGLAVVMLSMAAMAGVAITIYAGRYFAGSPEQARSFWPLWLALWSSLNALFLSADVFNLYVTLELLGLSAVALAGIGGRGPAMGSTMRYLLVALAGSMLYLIGVALIYGVAGHLDWRTLASAVGESPATRIALVLTTVGLAMKVGLFPAHFWLPPTHGSAAAPVSALLSGLVIKGAFYVLLRMWLWVFPDVITLEARHLMAVLGALAILWGSVMALRQKRLKRLVAYSTVAQVGYLFVALDMIDNGASSALAWKGCLSLAVAHGLAKGAMFMAAGTMQHAAGHDRLAELKGIGLRMPMSVFAFGLAGVSLMGLPPSGGFIGKWFLLNAAVGSGKWWLVAVVLAGGLLAAGYVFRVLSGALLQNDELKLAHRPHWLLEATAVGLAMGSILMGVAASEPLAMMMRAAPAVVTMEVAP